VSILLGEIIPATTGDQYVKDGIKTAPVIGSGPSHHPLTAHLVGDSLPLLIGDGDFHAAIF
jgi:hypothetical protein